MATAEDKKHDLLLIIVAILFVRFSIGAGAEENVPPTIVIPSAR